MACPRKALHRAALGVGLFAATPRYRCGVSASIPQAFTLTSLSTMPMISARRRKQSITKPVLHFLQRYLFTAAFLCYWACVFG